MTLNGVTAHAPDDPVAMHATIPELTFSHWSVLAHYLGMAVEAVVFKMALSEHAVVEVSAKSIEAVETVAPLQ